jgi:2-polyprenyl-3-methyl-5-hydroxy-6-metoxy-1,4-benzoquinol methylase
MTAFGKGGRMLQFVRRARIRRISAPLIARAEGLAASGRITEARAILRQLPLEAFGSLLLAPPSSAPTLRTLLPRMASAEVQQHWTGASGEHLMRISVEFMRSVDTACREYFGHGIEGKVLDYGCGWGRLLRLLLAYVEPERIYGADPMEASLDLCREYQCPGQLALCANIPTALPFAETFDLIYAFSVFTHLSEMTADAVLGALRGSISSNGMLVITIRPSDYWAVHTAWHGDYSPQNLRERHETNGFAFIPHAHQPSSEGITYGDTSMTLDFIRRRWPQWKIAGTARNARDPYQVLVFMLPA